MGKFIFSISVIAVVITAAGTVPGSTGTAGAAAPNDGSGAVVRTDSGPVRGTVATEYRSFQGIPYAAPPVGDLRWRPPRPPERWKQARDATKPGNRCAQGPGGGGPSTAEDCLYLNVITPRPAGHTTRRPVMVWFNGGAFSYGSGSDVDPHRLAVGGDVDVVTINHRLGVFGFFGYPGLTGSGEFGLEDQQAALRWVRRNAAAFGGDPRNVTLFGESGGTFGVCAALTSPSAAGLFQRAIMQSGSCTTKWPDDTIVPGVPAGSPWLPLSTVRTHGVALARRQGCDDPATAVNCLRRVPAAGLLSGEQGVVLTSAAYGGRVLPARPDRALADGRFNRVPVISGTNRDEGRLDAALLPQPFTEQLYQQFLHQAYGGLAGRVATRYPSSAFGSPALAWAAAATDGVWACRQLTADRLFARRAPVFGYEFADRDAPATFPFPPGLPHGAFHTAELPYLFDLPGVTPGFTPQQRELSDQMTRYWARFATTGDPNGPGSPRWSPLRGSAVESLAPGAGGIHPVDLSLEHNFTFWANQN